MSTTFKFNLQKVLDVRGVVEEAKAIDLQRAQAETEVVKRELANTAAEKQTIIHGSNKTSKTTMSDLRNRTAYIDQLSEKIENQGMAVSDSQLKTEEKRQNYIQASKEKMVMEKLKEHHRDVFRKKVNQEHVKAESEVASRITRKVGNS